ncbi:hypothetical protein ABIF66_009772 [Bradyrhizobium japonicum]
MGHPQLSDGYALTFLATAEWFLTVCRTRRPRLTSKLNTRVRFPSPVQTCRRTSLRTIVAFDKDFPSGARRGRGSLPLLRYAFDVEGNDDLRWVSLTQALQVFQTASHPGSRLLQALLQFGLRCQAALFTGKFLEYHGRKDPPFRSVICGGRTNCKRRSRPTRKGLAWGLQSVDQRVCKSLAGGMEAATTENYEVRPNDQGRSSSIRDCG